MNAKAIRHGLSLLEVILAIAILGGALAVIGQLMRIGARSAIEARDQATAQLYCETKMNEVAAGVELPESVSDSPLDETGEWVYSVDVTSTDLDGILALNVTVSQNPQSFSRPISRSFARWIADPEFAQTAADEEATIAQAFTDAQAIATGPVSGTTKGQTVAMDGSAGGAMAGGGGQADAGGGRRRPAAAKPMAAEEDVVAAGKVRAMAEWVAPAVVRADKADKVAGAGPAVDKVDKAEPVVGADQAGGKVVLAADKADPEEDRAAKVADRADLVAKVVDVVDFKAVHAPGEVVQAVRADLVVDRVVLAAGKAVRVALAAVDRAAKAADSVARAAVAKVARVLRADLAAAKVAQEEAVAVERNRSTARSRPGVTLLELILALSLSILVLMAISMAINLHFRVLDVRRTNVEEARLASAVLKHMADDLRCALQYTPPDLSGLEALTSSLTSSGAGAALAAVAGQALGGTSGGQGGASGGGGGTTGGGQGGTGGAQGPGGGGQQGTGGGNQQAGQPTSGGGQGGGQGAQSSAGGQTQGSGGGQSLGGGAPTGASGTTGQPSGTAASGATSTTSTTESTETTETTTTSTVVGFFGSATELRFDISRLPRVDQYEVIQSSGDDSKNQFPSDLKTVIYFLQNDDNGQAVISPGLGGSVGFAEPSTSGRGRGLMRAEQDRAVLALAEESGIDTAVYGNAKILAEEVVGLAFQYYDGTDWLTDWDSSSTGTLPRAVEIVLTIQPTYAMNERDLAATPETSTAPEYNFRLVVRLPSAPLVAPTTTEETTTDSSSSTATGSTTNSATGATSGSQAQGTMP